MKLRRIIAIFIDFILVALLTILITWPIHIALKINRENFIHYDLLNSFILYLIFIFKDILVKRKSLGKKVMRLKIVLKDRSIPSVLFLILRNLFIIWPIWLIEVLLVIIFNKRLGDIIFKTRVVEDNGIKVI